MTTTSERLRRIQQLFDEILETPVEQREAHLDRVCAEDADMRAEVVALLNEHDRLVEGFMRTPDMPSREPLAPEPGDCDVLVGTRIGNFMITRVIAFGGMGSVFEAQQQSPSRIVALKLLRPGVTSAYAMRHFKHESQILARLRHAHIAQVYEAGTTTVDKFGGSTVPYFAMEYIEGARTLTEYASDHRTTITRRIELFIQVCEAVHHGHQKGVIHRDLKPGNVLVDDEGHVKVIDFGIARSTDADIAMTTIHSDGGQLVGTLQYMSPEQCRVDSRDLDTRTDVYSLGVVLHELLCGQLPYDVTRTTLVEAARVICEQPPTRIRDINRSLSGDLETIVSMALEKDRDQRYQSTLDLAADLRRVVNNEPILARPASTGYRMRKFVRRNKSLSAALVLLVVSVCAAVMAGVNWSWAQREKQFRLQLEYATLIGKADRSIERSDVTQAGQILDRDRSDFGELVAWEWDYLNAELDHSAASVELVPVAGCTARELVFNSNGSHVAGTCTNGTVHVWDARSGEHIYGLEERAVSAMVVAFAQGDKTLIIGTEEGHVRTWQFGTDNPMSDPLGSGERPSKIETLAVDPANSLIAAAHHESKDVVLWDLPNRNEFSRLKHEHAIEGFAFRADGKAMAVALRNGMLCLWDLETGAAPTLLLDHGTRIDGVLFSKSGRDIVFWDHSKSVLRWEQESNNLVELTGCPHPVESTAIRDDQEAIAVGTTQGCVCLWLPRVRRAPFIMPAGGRSRGSVTALLFDQEGGLFSLSQDFIVRRWDTELVIDRDEIGRHGSTVRSVTFSPCGQFLFSAGAEDGTVYVWDTIAREHIGTLDGGQTSVVSVAVSSDGRRVVTGSEDGYVRTWDLFSPRAPRTLSGHEDQVLTVAISPDNALIASGSKDGTIRFWDVADHALAREPWTEEGRWIKSIGFSPDGKYLAVASSAPTNESIDVEGRHYLTVLRVHDGRPLWRHTAESIQCLAYSHNGQQIVAASGEHVVRVRNARSGDILLECESVSSSSVVFTPDDKRFVTGHSDHTVRLWNARTVTELLTLRSATSPVSTVAVSPDGRRIVSGGGTGAIRSWEDITFAERCKMQRAVRAVQHEAHELIDTLYSRYGTWSAVVDEIESSYDPKSPIRQAAISEIIRRLWGD